MDPKRTIVLGGGFGGIAAALQLRALAPADHRITLIDRDEQLVIGAGQTWVMLGKAEVDQIQTSRRALESRGVEVIVDEVLALDPERRVVTLPRGQLEADFLVVALGAQLNLGAVPGLAGAHTFYSLDGAVRLRDALAGFEGGQVVVLIPRSPFKCPPAPYEVAVCLNDYFAARGRRTRVRLSLYTLEPAPMPTAGPLMGQFLRDRLAAADVSFHPLHKPARVAEGRIEFEGGAEVAYDLLIAVPPHQPPAVAVASGLCSEGGWISVDPATLRTRFSSVWAIGDISSVPLPGRFNPEVPLNLPKAGTFAERHGMAVAGQIAALARGAAATATYDGTGSCFIETGRGTAVRGDGAFFASPHPLVQPSGDPSPESYEEKQRWVESHLKFEPPG